MASWKGEMVMTSITRIADQLENAKWRHFVEKTDRWIDRLWRWTIGQLVNSKWEGWTHRPGY